jgi:peptidoglycan/xylan/chitin deacetylase (PgdA/CDA1 family)
MPAAVPAAGTVAGLRATRGRMYFALSGNSRMISVEHNFPLLLTGVPAYGTQQAGVLMTGSAFPADSFTVFAARRRRVILAAGAITLTTGLLPRLVGGRPGAPVREVAVRRRVPVHHVGPSYPLDRPLYYVDDAAKAIALTIDDGPDPVYTPQVLAVLHRYGVTATFSMIGLHVAAYPQLAREVHQAGHKIANHTWTHADLAVMRRHEVHDELARASHEIHQATGVQPDLFRAPYGAWSADVIRQCEHMKMVPLDWSVDPRDWAEPGTASIIRNIMTNTRPGSIILEHDGGGNRSETVQALRVVLPRLLGDGYRFTTP